MKRMKICKNNRKKNKSSMRSPDLEGDILLTLLRLTN